MLPSGSLKCPETFPGIYEVLLLKFSFSTSCTSTPGMELKGHQGSCCTHRKNYVSSTTSRKVEAWTSFCAACLVPSMSWLSWWQGHCCYRHLIVAETCVTLMMRGIKEDLQLTLQSQQEGSESCSALSSVQRIERVWEVQESESECLERDPMLVCLVGSLKRLHVGA